MCLKQIKAESLAVNVFYSRDSLGMAAAQAVSERINSILCEKPDVNIVFASAPSQNEFLAALLEDVSIPWNRVKAFHLDEYIGLSGDAPQGFGNFIREKLWGRVPLKASNYMDGNAADLNKECQRYADLLRANPIDIVCFGIGENGHLAFNDPSVADFLDQAIVKVVKLDAECRQQQVHDGCFRRLEDVPTHAMTMTIPAIMAGRWLYGMVPGRTKAEALQRTVAEPVGINCPATILRSHPNAVIYADTDSAGLLTT
jgi:glucosamine-6-phosphate deaminase